MKFGVYVHIPYCLQRCSYCDFATYVHTEIIPPQDYLLLLQSEIRRRANWIGPRPLDTLYFGGGTPSLVDPQIISAVIASLKESGFDLRPGAEVTIEINPATISDEKLDAYLAMGVNRFSVGAQTFNDDLLRSVRREHSSDDTRHTLDLLRSRNLNYSFDLLFALPGQTLAGLELDLNQVESYLPPHVSPYCLTVPESHPLAKLSLPEALQIEMFEMISSRLEAMGYAQYEISNFCRPGFESRHNSLYWDNDEYWGIGLSSHSYLLREKWGVRFWNPKNLDQYQKQKMDAQQISSELDPEHFEVLERHQALTDYCHISLRRAQGLSLLALANRFGHSVMDLVQAEVDKMSEKGLLRQGPGGCFSLTKTGILMSNQVFSKLTFLEEDLAPRAP